MNDYSNHIDIEPMRLRPLEMKAWVILPGVLYSFWGQKNGKWEKEIVNVL